MPLLLLALLLSAPFSSPHAQATAAAPTPSCTAELDWATDFVGRNYAGFDVKVTDATRPAYQSLLDSLRAAANRASTISACDDILRRWVRFFEDGHLSFGRQAASSGASTSAAEALRQSPEAIRARFVNWERTPLTEAQARARLDSLGGSRSEIEGIWQSLDGRYHTAVLRDARAGRDYTMTILRADSIWWMPGQTKATFARSDSGFDARFYMLDHEERQWKANVDGNVLTFDSGSTWLRVWPTTPGDFTAESLRATQNTRFAAREVAPGTVLVQIPTFGAPRQIDSLFEAEGARIRAADRLIIDLRNNGGGSDINYRQLLPLIYTQPIRIVSLMALVTEDNILVNEALANDTTLPLAQRLLIKQGIEVMRPSLGGWHVFDDRDHTEAAVLDRPREVAVLMDRGCASSCEQFLLAAQQSGKVTLYGDRSAGILDFGNVREFSMPGGTLVMRYPTTRSKRVPHAAIDNVGIQPHVRMPAGTRSPIDWVLEQMDARR